VGDILDTQKAILHGNQNDCLGHLVYLNYITNIIGAEEVWRMYTWSKTILRFFPDNKTNIYISPLTFQTMHLKSVAYVTFYLDLFRKYIGLLAVTAVMTIVVQRNDIPF
jgi:hypothetical protein